MAGTSRLWIDGLSRRAEAAEWIRGQGLDRREARRRERIGIRRAVAVRSIPIEAGITGTN